MKPTTFTLTEPEYRALRLKAEEAKRLRRCLLRERRIALEVSRKWGHLPNRGGCNCLVCARWHRLDRALARRKQ